MTKKDYTDNWESELHEQFAFWSPSEWKRALSAAGFTVLEEPAHPDRGTRSYTNPWIVEHRFEGAVELWRRTSEGLERLPWPPTNVVLVGEKR